MNDKTVLDEIRGTITEVYEYPVSKGKTITSMEKGIIIQPDDETKGTISEAFMPSGHWTDLLEKPATKSLHN